MPPPGSATLGEASTAALLEELRRSQDRLRKEVLSGQASILTEIRNLHQFWKDQLGASGAGLATSSATSSGTSSGTFKPAMAPGSKGSKVNRASISEALSTGLEEFTDSVVKNIEGLTSAFAESAGLGVPPPALGNRKRENAHSVRFADQRVELHRATAIAECDEGAEELEREEEERPVDVASAADFMPVAKQQLERKRVTPPSEGKRTERKRPSLGEANDSGQSYQTDEPGHARSSGDADVEASQRHKPLGAASETATGSAGAAVSQQDADRSSYAASAEPSEGHQTRRTGTAGYGGEDTY